MCLTKQQTIKWFRIINWKTKMLDKISKSNSHNWRQHKKYQYLYLKNKLVIKKRELDLSDCTTPDGIPENIYFNEYNKLTKFNNWLFKINKKYNYA